MHVQYRRIAMAGNSALHHGVYLYTALLETKKTTMIYIKKNAIAFFHDQYFYSVARVCTILILV